MKLKKYKACSDNKNNHHIYTLKENCPKCNSLTFDAHYKFIKLKDVSDKN